MLNIIPYLDAHPKDNAAFFEKYSQDRISLLFIKHGIMN